MRIVAPVLLVALAGCDPVSAGALERALGGETAIPYAWRIEPAADTGEAERLGGLLDRFFAWQEMDRGKRREAVARNLYNAFLASKNRSIERLMDPAVSRYPVAWLPTYMRKMAGLFGSDTFPYGIEENRPTWEQMLRYTNEQGIAHRRAKPEEIFPKGIMTSVRV